MFIIKTNTWILLQKKNRTWMDYLISLLRLMGLLTLIFTEHVTFVYLEIVFGIGKLCHARIIRLRTYQY